MAKMLYPIRARLAVLDALSSPKGRELLWSFSELDAARFGNRSRLWKAKSWEETLDFEGRRFIRRHLSSIEECAREAGKMAFYLENGETVEAARQLSHSYASGFVIERVTALSKSRPTRPFARWKGVSPQQQQTQQVGPGATQGSPITIKVTGNYQANVRDTNIDVATAGVTVTLPTNPQLGTTVIEFAAEQAFNLSGGVNPFMVDPRPIPAGSQFLAVFTGVGWLLSPNPGASSPLSPTSLTGTIYIDPQASNVAGASDTSPPVVVPTGQSVSGPVFKSFRGVIAQWGSLTAVLQATTAIIGLSNHTDNSDPIVLTPIVSGTAAGAAIRMSLQGVLTLVTTITGGLAVVAKSRAAGANSLLQATFNASAAVAQLAINTTHPSRGFPYKSLGANAFSMTQPFVAQTIGGTVAPAETDTWASTDTVTLNTMTNLNVEAFNPIIADQNSTAEMLNVSMFAPGGAQPQSVILGTIRMRECTCNRVPVAPSTVRTNDTLVSVNCFFAKPGGNVSNVLNGVLLVGGAINSLWDIAGPFGSTFDGDTILGSTTTSVNYTGPGDGQLAFAFLDAPFQYFTGVGLIQAFLYGGAVIYGSGANTINIAMGTHVSQIQGTYTATFTAPGLVTGIKLNGVATGSSHTGASPDVLNSGIATTPANLDAAAGAAGFGGDAFILGGASISNFAADHP